MTTLEDLYYGNTAPPTTESQPTTVSETVITETTTEIIYKYIIPQIGSIKLNKLTQNDLQ